MKISLMIKSSLICFLLGLSPVAVADIVQRDNFADKITVERVPGQKGASCGYHAVFNALKALGVNLDESIRTSNFAEWRKDIVRERNNNIVQRTQGIKNYIGQKVEEVNKFFNVNLNENKDYTDMLAFLLAEGKEVKATYNKANITVINKVITTVNALVQSRLKEERIADGHWAEDLVEVQAFNVNVRDQAKPLINILDELIKKINLYGASDWLNDEELQGIVSSKFDNLPAYDKISVIATIDVFDPSFGSVHQYGREAFFPLLHFPADFEKQFKNGGKCVFILGTMSSANHAVGGHWYALVVEQDIHGNRTYKVLDSLNNKNQLYNPLVVKIVREFGDVQLARELSASSNSTGTGSASSGWWNRLMALPMRSPAALVAAAGIGIVGGYGLYTAIDGWRKEARDDHQEDADKEVNQENEKCDNTIVAAPSTLA